MVDLVLRDDKGSELTYEELDTNQENLASAIEAMEALTAIGYSPTVSADLRGVPSANLTMVRRVFTQPWTFPINLAGSVFNSTTPAAMTSTFDIRKILSPSALLLSPLARP